MQRKSYLLLKTKLDKIHYIFSIFGNLTFKNFMNKGYNKCLFDLIPFFVLPSHKNSPKQVFRPFGKNL